MKKQREQKKCVIKRVGMIDDYVKCIESKQIKLKTQQGFKSHALDVYFKIANKIVPSSNDDKRQQSFNKAKSFPY